MLAAGALVALAVQITSDGDRHLLPGGGNADDSFDPLAFRSEAAPALERRAAAGLSHVLYTKSPGGVVGSARRTAKWRRQIEAIASRSGLDPDLLEAIVLLESGGRTDVVAGSNPEAAAGLTQILAETAVNLLGLRVDLGESRRLTGMIHAAEHRGDRREATLLQGRRRRIDERFDPAKALAAMGRYLSVARERFGRADLAVVSYHMGIGNLEEALRLYADETDDPISEVVEDSDLSYTRLYFDSTPLLHADAFAKLASLGDDSATYLWRVLAAREILRLHRASPDRLRRLESLHGSRPSAEQVLHPPERAEIFEDPAELRLARSARHLVALPASAARFSLALDPGMGRLAGRLGEAPGAYRALRPHALALSAYLALGVRAISGEGPLVLRNAVQDRDYQRLLADSSPEAARQYSLHTTGYAFDVVRAYRSPDQAQAFQFWLDRLEAMNLIAWSRDASVIHVTVSEDASVLVPVILGQKAADQVDLGP